jgi:hypothetical protein
MAEQGYDQRCSIFVTEAKEYVVRDRTCLRLRDRRSGRWEQVLPNRLLGSVPPPPEHYLCETGEPRIGDRLCIQMGSRYVVSTPILAIEHALATPEAEPHGTRPRASAPTPAASERARARPSTEGRRS